MDVCLASFLIHSIQEVAKYVQGSAKEWTLGCVKRNPVAREGQDAEITQPGDHSLADYP